MASINTATVLSSATKLGRDASLWESALQKLPASDKTWMTIPKSGELDILNQILAVAEAKKELCLQRRWKFKKKGGEVIIIRDQLEKFTTFINRFKEVGSVAVQCDPVHAGLPWAGILVLLQIATNDSQTFGAMVDGVETMARILPRCSVLEEIYLQGATLSPVKRQLQICLLRLYTSVLRYLVRARQYFTKSTAKRVLKSALSTSESQVQCHLDIISKKLGEVDTCLLVVQSEESKMLGDRLENVLERLAALERPIIRSSAQIAELYSSLSRQEKTRLLNWLSQAKSRQHHRSEGEGYLPGSGAWLLQHAEFLNWRDTSSSTILWLHGIPGCGKTKLAYSTIQKLLHDSQTSPNPGPVAYFYCARNPAEQERSNPEEVIRSLLKQLSMTSQGQVKDVVVKEFKARDREAETDGTNMTALSMSDSKALILQLLERDPATLIVDAVDECEHGKRHELLSTLEDILAQSSSVVKVMVTSRDDGDICHHLDGSPNIYIRADDNHHDIERFIDHALSQVLAGKRLLNGHMSDDLRAVVSQTLKEKAHGMFRWVTLQIDNLCDNRRIKIESDVREEVGRLPQTLRESYDRSYRRVLDLARPSRVLAERVFKWLLCAQTLMTAEELVAAVMFASERHVISSQNILDICCNMVVADDQGHFRFAHLSVREYLETLDCYTSKECHSFVLQRCLESYINTAVDWKYQFYNAWDLSVKPYAMVYWPHHCRDIGNPFKDTALALITESFFFRDITSEESQAMSDGSPTKRPGDPFNDWVSDIWNFTQSSMAVEVDYWQLKRLESASSPSASPLFFACTFDFAWILEKMQEYGWKDWTTRNNLEETSLQLVCRWGSTNALRLVLRYFEAASCAAVEALSEAIECRNFDSAKVLIEHNVNGFEKLQDKDSPLNAATVAGCVDIVEAILDKTQLFKAYSVADAMCLAHDRSKEHMFPMFWKSCTRLDPSHYFRLVLAVQAILHEDNPFVYRSEALEELFEALLKYAQSSTSSELRKIHRLSKLLHDRFQDIIVLPDDTLALSNPNYRSRFLDHPFILARDDVEIFEILLGLGAENIQGIKEYLLPDEDTELFTQMPENWLIFELLSCQYAKHAGQMIKILIDRGVDVNYADYKGRTPLMVASKSCTSSVLDILLDGGASVENLDKKGQNALMHALKNGNDTAVSKLVQHGLDINASLLPNTNISPLFFAVCECDCDFAMMEFLRRNGARRPGYALVENYLSVPFLAMVSEESVDSVVCLLQSGGVMQDCQSGISELFGALVTSRRTNPFLDDGQKKSLQGATPGAEASNDALTTISQTMINCRSSEDGLTPLQAAICLEHQEAFKRLLDIPVDVNAVDNQGFSALHYAVTAGHDTITRELLLNGANPYLQDRNGRMPLHLAAGMDSWRGPHVIGELLKAMAAERLDIKDANGNTAMHIAAMAANADFMKLIFNAGASAYRANKDGKTPIDLAMVSCSIEVFHLRDNIDIFSDAHQILFDPDSFTGDVFADEQDEEAKREKLLSDDVQGVDDDNDEANVTEVLGVAELAERAGESVPLKPAMGSKPRLEEDVDWFNAYDLEEWTALQGRSTLPLRPLCAMYRGNE